MKGKIWLLAKATHDNIRGHLQSTKIGSNAFRSFAGCFGPRQINRKIRMKHFIELLARLLLAVIFVFEVYDCIAHFQTTKEQMLGYGITWNPDFLLYTTLFLLILGSLLITTGYRVKLGVLLLLAYLIPLTFIAYDFWELEIGPERRMVSIVFMKNIAIMGGLLLLWVNGSGRYSVRRLFATTKVPGA